MAVTKVTASVANSEAVLSGNNDIYKGDLGAPLEPGIYSVNIFAYDDAGNVSVANSETNAELALDVRIWKKPKTDWKPTDRLNYWDYNRIKNNLVYLHEFALTLWPRFEISDMGEDMVDFKGFWDVDIFNLFEENLETINKNIFTQDFGISQKFYENGPLIKWDELNRIESAILSINDLLERQKAGLSKLSFRLGTFKEVKI